MTFKFDLFMITLMCLFTLWIVIGNKVRLSDIQERLEKLEDETVKK
ncbi:MAG: hypothetical protein KAU62_02560 [Candidatus Heimdallarchaeota archaeon]|nr:hypothetical protein [Candidatus Heimdallarchaeota archaeon]MCK4610018.1 hypothetical protein [Candidatus Heimdallarchaeota archaeon]